jgi:hypothetical protein
MGSGRSIRTTKGTELDIAEPFRIALALAKHNIIKAEETTGEGAACATVGQIRY